MTSQPDDADAPVPGARLLELVQVMDMLRRDCPWDAGQTHESLTPYLLEETYEAVDALAAGDQAAVREELGDVLLQVVFHARVAAERTDGTGYDIDDVADGIIAKLTRRHPHVFGDVTVSGADEVTPELGRDQGRRAGRETAGHRRRGRRRPGRRPSTVSRSASRPCRWQRSCCGGRRRRVPRLSWRRPRRTQCARRGVMVDLPPR